MNVSSIEGDAIANSRPKNTTEITAAMCAATHRFALQGHTGPALVRSVATALGSNQPPSAILALFCAWIERSTKTQRALEKERAK